MPSKPGCPRPDGLDDAVEDVDLWDLLFRPNEPVAGGQCRVVRVFAHALAWTAADLSAGGKAPRGPLLGCVLGAVHMGLGLKLSLCTTAHPRYTRFAS